MGLVVRCLCRLDIGKLDKYSGVELCLSGKVGLTLAGNFGIELWNMCSGPIDCVNFFTIEAEFAKFVRRTVFLIKPFPIFLLSSLLFCL